MIGLGVNRFSRGRVVVAEVEFVTSAIDTTDANTYTFSGQSLGAEAPDRKIVIAIYESATGGVSITGVTVAGQAASQVIAKTITNEGAELWQVALPTGTTGDVVVTCSSANDGCGIGVFRVTGAQSAAHDTGGSTGTAPASDTLDIPAGGVAIGVAGQRRDSTATVTWAGLTEDYDADGVLSAGVDTHSGASGAFGSTQTGLTISATFSAAGIRNPVMALASWGPA